MKTLVSVIITVFAVNSRAKAQDAILDIMTDKAEVIAHVKILDHKQIFYTADGTGIEPYRILCRVIEPIKGSVTRHQEIQVVYHRYEDAPPALSEPPLVERDKNYVLFLKGQWGDSPLAKNGEIEYKLLDRWVGVLPYHHHLGRTLTHKVKK